MCSLPRFMVRLSRSEFFPKTIIYQGLCNPRAKLGNTSLGRTRCQRLPCDNRRSTFIFSCALPGWTAVLTHLRPSIGPTNGGGMFRGKLDGSQDQDDPNISRVSLDDDGKLPIVILVVHIQEIISYFISEQGTRKELAKGTPNNAQNTRCPILPGPSRKIPSRLNHISKVLNCYFTSGINIFRAGWPPRSRRRSSSQQLSPPLPCRLLR